MGRFDRTDLNLTPGPHGTRDDDATAPQDLWRRVEQLCHAALRITAEHELNRLLQEIADSAREVSRARYAALGVLNERRDGLAQFVVSGIRREEYARIGSLPQGKGILGILIRKPQPIRMKDLTRHPAAHGFPPHHPPMRSFLGVPIVGRGGPIGNLYLTEKIGAEEFSEQDEAFAVMLAAHAAVAVENARHDRERERLVQELRALQRSRDRFFAMINHELRNALTAVHGWAELWLKKAGPKPPRAAREVAESAERAVTLLEDMLDLSRLDDSRLTPKVGDADARDVVREAAAALEPQAAQRRVVIETAEPDGPVPLRSDPMRIRQILVNLLSNAVRHSPEGGTVTVSVASADDRLRVDVTDRGPGIPPEEQVVIFEAFERAKGDASPGTGLGLTLSRKLARLLGGDLTVASRPGEGARFRLEIPRFLTPT